MSLSEPVPRYGVKEQTIASGVGAESLRLVGYVVVDGGYSQSERDEFAKRFDLAQEVHLSRHGGREALAEIDEHNTIRAPLAIDDIFLKLATNPNILALCEVLLGNPFILNQQNGIINPPNAARYNQASYHRDLPYQHFVVSRPLAINALYCIDPFTNENGATKILPGSHKQEAFPADETIRALERQVAAPAGSFIVLDCMVFHCSGINRTATARRAVNHVYSLPFLKQQISLPSVLGNHPSVDATLKKLLDYGNDTPASICDYYTRRRARLKRGQS